jgi:ABC-type multidrug transport system fused ATPase/permease subunit
MEAMARLMCGRTTFMIAHRLSTLAQCDMRLQVESGCLIDTMMVVPERKGDGDD